MLLLKIIWLYYVKTLEWVGGSENGKFSMHYVLKMSIRRFVCGSKKPQNIHK